MDSMPYMITDIESATFEIYALWYRINYSVIASLRYQPSKRQSSICLSVLPSALVRFWKPRDIVISNMMVPIRWYYQLRNLPYHFHDFIQQPTSLHQCVLVKDTISPLLLFLYGDAGIWDRKGTNDISLRILKIIAVRFTKQVVGIRHSIIMEESIQVFIATWKWNRFFQYFFCQWWKHRFIC